MGPGDCNGAQGTKREQGPHTIQGPGDHNGARDQDKNLRNKGMRGTKMYSGTHNGVQEPKQEPRNYKGSEGPYQGPGTTSGPRDHNGAQG